MRLRRFFLSAREAFHEYQFQINEHNRESDENSLATRRVQEIIF